MHLHLHALLVTMLISLSLVSAHGPRAPSHRRHLAARRLEKRVPKDGVLGGLLAGGPNSPASGSQSSVEPTSSPTSMQQRPHVFAAPEAQAVSLSSSSVSTTSSITSSSHVPSSTSSVPSSFSPSSELISSTASPSSSSSSIAPSSATSNSSSVAPSSTSSTTPSSSSSSSSSSSGIAPSTLYVTKPLSTDVQTVSPTVLSNPAVVTPSASSDASKDGDKEGKSGGLSKGGLIAIIVVVSVVGLAGAAWTAFRKWKLRPSNRFEERMKGIDFGPGNDGLGDAYVEKTLYRTASNTSADRQRQQLVAELDHPGQLPPLTAGVPQHDFTAGVNHSVYGGYQPDEFTNDPFAAHSQVYEYNAPMYPQGAVVASGHDQAYAYHHDPPTQDQPMNDGYADLQRGDSHGSGSRSGHGHTGQAITMDFPHHDNYIGRPTGGSDGPYAQAASYRI